MQLAADTTDRAEVNIGALHNEDVFGAAPAAHGPGSGGLAGSLSSRNSALGSPLVFPPDLFAHDILDLVSPDSESAPEFPNARDEGVAKLTRRELKKRRGTPVSHNVVSPQNDKGRASLYGRPASAGPSGARRSGRIAAQQEELGAYAASIVEEGSEA